MALFGPTIRQLIMPDFNKALDLYARAFRYDEYFTQQFQDRDAYLHIKDYYAKDIQNTIRFGIAYGMFDRHNEIIAAVFAVNPMDWSNNHRDAYDSLFNTQEVETSAWCDYMLDHFQKMQQRVCYIYGLVVDENKRCRGNGTKMLKYIIQQYGGTHTIVGDPTNENGIQLWLKNGFHKEYMGTVMVVVRN